MKIIIVIAFAWWFYWIGDGKLIGPFKTEIECKRILAEFKEKVRLVTSCYEGFYYQ